MTDLQDDLELLRDHRSELNGDDRDRIAAEIEKLQEQLHYATGTCDLAIKHRDSAEAQNERLTAERDDAREQRRKWQEASVADRAENERLRTALEDARHYAAVCPVPAELTGPTRIEMLERRARIAQSIGTEQKASK